MTIGSKVATALVSYLVGAVAQALCWGLAFGHFDRHSHVTLFGDLDLVVFAPFEPPYASSCLIRELFGEKSCTYLADNLVSLLVFFAVAVACYFCVSRLFFSKHRGSS